MRVLFICRLFSGFEGSLVTRRWNPTGSPTIAHLIKHLDHSDTHELTLVLTCKDFNSGWKEKKDQTLQIEGLHTPVLALVGKMALPGWLGKFQGKLSDIRQFWRLYQLYRREKPDLIYCDRVNILPAALFARFTKTPVIWRVMGILDDMRRDSSARTMRAALRRFLWRSPFTSVICTLDGSGGGPWMDRTLNPTTKRHLLLNGFDFNLPADKTLALSQAPVRVLFAGRLETLKGPEEFLETAVRLLQIRDDYKIFFAGDGSLRPVLEQRVAEEKLQDKIIFLGQLAPAGMRAARQQCDIYVSLNKQGNLSNVNLEAMADGMVVIVPQSCMRSGIDLDTDRLIPADVFYRFGRVDDQEALLQALLKFADSQARRPYQLQAVRLSKNILKSWDERIDQELAIIDEATVR